MSYFQTILARLLALTDKVLEAWTSTPDLIEGANPACNSSAINVVVNQCGLNLVEEIQGLVFGGMAFLNGLLATLGAGSY